MKLPTSRGRVVRHSPSQANREILASMRKSIERHMEDDADQIEQRLRELESEWDIERLLETNAAALSLAGLALGATVNRKFYILPAIICGFLLQHGLQGWCPPVEILRRLGVRTTEEIDGERYALKLIRGDFKDVQQSLESGGAQAEAILKAMGPHAGVQGRKAMKGKNGKISAGHN